MTLMKMKIKIKKNIGDKKLEAVKIKFYFLEKHSKKESSRTDDENHKKKNKQS